MLLGAFVLAAGVGHAQSRPKATVTPIVERDSVHAGTPVRVALQVRLPEGAHVQSDKPRDPSLIPSELRVVDAPAGVTVDEIVYPPSTDLKQVGSEQPLAVFEREFAIGVHLTLAPGLRPGDLSVPVTFKYQACNDTTLRR